MYDTTNNGYTFFFGAVCDSHTVFVYIYQYILYARSHSFIDSVLNVQNLSIYMFEFCSFLLSSQFSK